MEENNVLDDLWEEFLKLVEYYCCVLCFLFYVVGIVGVVGVCFWFLVKNIFFDELIFEVDQFYFFGLVGVWLFLGLGLFVIFWVCMERFIDFFYVGVFIVYFIVFVISCINLLKYYIQQILFFSQGFVLFVSDFLIVIIFVDGIIFVFGQVGFGLNVFVYIV